MKDFEKLFKQGIDDAKYFKNIAEQTMDHMNVQTSSDEARLAVSFMTATHMAIGANVVRNKYLIAGAAVGILGTVAGAAIGKGIEKLIKSKKSKEKSEDSIED